MAIGEAITNIAAAKIDHLSNIKLSANWMAPAGFEGDDANLFDTVAAVGLELCPQLGISIPVGKDSMAMRTAWREGAQDKQVVSPVSLVISAFSPVSDIRRTLTPVLRPDLNTQLILIDLGGGKNRMGGSILHQAYLLEHGDVPDLDSAKILQAFFKAIQDLNKRNKILAYQDRSDGGLIVTLAECMFASHVGLTIDLEVGSDHNRQLAALFSEELGAVIQIDNSAELEVHSILESYGLADCARKIGCLNDKGALEISSNGSPLMDEAGLLLQRTWSKTTFQMQSMRDNPECAKQEYDRILDTSDPGLNAHLTFDINDSHRAAVINKGAKPKIAVLRDQGVNGQI